MHSLQQFGKTQHHQRHHVIAVQVGIENQVGLIADSGEQLAPFAQQLAALAGERLRIRRAGCRSGSAGKLLQRSVEALTHIGSAQLFVVGRAHPGKPGEDLCHLRGLQGSVKKLPHQAVTHHRGVGCAHDLLACEIDGQVLFVDQDAGDVDHRRQIQQIDEHELAAHTEAAQPTRYAMHECHGVCCEGPPGRMTWAVHRRWK